MHHVEESLSQVGGAKTNTLTEDGDMKLVMAIIKPFKLDDVREALTPLGVQGLTVRKGKPKSTAARNITWISCPR